MNWLYDLRVGTKLIVGFVMVAAIAAIIGIFGTLKINRVEEESSKLYEKITVPLGNLAGMSTAFQRVRINLRDAVESNDPAEFAAYRGTILQLRDVVSEKGARFEKTILTDEGRKLYQEFQESRKAYGGYIDQILQLRADNKQSEALVLLRGEAKNAAMLEQEMLDKLMASKEKQAKLTDANNEMIANSASRLMIALSVVGALLAISLGLIIAKLITRPISRAVEVANRLAAGDLTVTVESGCKDETGQLLLAMQHMVENLRDLVSQTVTISSGVAAASTQLHATAEQIATGAEEVASQTGTVATASEEMAATSSDIAQNCVTAAEASQRSTTSTNAGAKVVQETIDGMVSIAELVRQTAKTVESLGERSEQIGDIVGTIEDIADQTNLLALNAAIEAARAGEQGRGFAVVADEVRALAARTATATKEIGAMIKAIQLETKGVVRSMEAGVDVAEKGAALAHRSGDALNDILGRINEVTMQVSQIATAAEQQTATTGEVTSNIQQITEVVQKTAQGAEETAAGAAQLAQQANDLQTLVSRFKIAA
jgi:methyl-accepting chemotaxis protein